MAENQTGTLLPASDEAAPLAANVQIVSPNVGVGPLVFAALPSDTTVRQLKEKIREALPSHPADDQQRLIHRGRLLSRDSDTLKDIFTEDLLRNGDQQTLHLVLRNVTDHEPPAPASSQATPLRGQSPAPGTTPAPQPHVHHHHHHHPHHRPHGVNAGAAGFGNPGLPLQLPPGFTQPGIPQAVLQQQQQQHQSMLQWMNQLQREAGYRQMLTQQQRERAAAGSHDIQDNANNGQGGGLDQTGGRSSPSISIPTQTVVREGVGPNGQYWRMTVNETITTPSRNVPQPGGGATSNAINRGPLSPAEVANMTRGADGSQAAQAAQTAQATQIMTNAMHRSASGASLANLANLTNYNGTVQPIQPGVTTPLFPGTPRYASRTATPDPLARVASHGNNPTAALPHSQAQPNQAPGPPVVYILSSPTGPRGLLINSASEMYITPATTRQTNPYPGHPLRHQAPLVFPTWPTSIPVQPQQQPQQRQPEAQPQVQPQAQIGQPVHARQVNPRVPIGPPRQFQAHPNNPGAGALVAAAWPHIWLITRLVLFVWWFTSNDPSWSRWLTMVAIAVAVFMYNTGVLNGLANQAWDPFRQHLEGLLPLADPNRQRAAQVAPVPRPAGPNGGQAGDGAAVATAHAAPAEPDPAAAAARLVRERRLANGNWLFDHVRRLERAGLLFLASIAPGVAERHIAELEAQERAERQRREAEEAAARAAAEAEAAAAAGEQDGGGETGQEQEGESNQRVGEDVAVDRPAVQDQPQPPLIQI